MYILKVLSPNKMVILAKKQNKIAIFVYHSVIDVEFFVNLYYMRIKIEEKNEDKICNNR